MTVMVVYLTTKPKTNSPEHFTIECNGRTSTAICEQITTVDKSQIGEYIGKLSSSDMLKLNQSLMHTFDISIPAERENNDSVVKRYEAQLEIYRELLKEELSK
jgi:mRNA interferase MazF